ncbi:MAG: C1 family peptidase [Bacteroidales bacterium]
MKKITLLTLFLCFITVLEAQDQMNRAPLNQDYKEYLRELKKETKARKNGFIPPPYSPDFSNFKQKKLTKESEKLPEYYDLRDEGLVTSVKNQGEFGTCWAFSNIGSIESTWLKIEQESYDLSEKNMVTCNGYLSSPNDGGNDMMVAAYLTRLDGPVAEEDDPYEELLSTSPCNSDPETVQYVPEARWLPDNRDEIKRNIMEYGAVSTSMRAAEENNYYNSNDHTWYYPGDEPSDHGVLIIGWDDNKEITGGPMSPDSKGAWIIKNSWGDDWGENGYFYLAYEDTRVLGSNAFYPVKWETNQYDTLYMHDKLGMVTSYGFSDEEAYGLIKFKAEGKDTIGRIGTFTNSYDTKLDVKIFDGFDEETGELTGLLDERNGQSFTYPGYHTIEVDAEPTDSFYVLVRYQTPNYQYPLPVEMAIDGYADPEIKPSGYHWVSNDGQEFTPVGSDIENNELDLCIRAYASRNNPQASFYSDKEKLCLEDTVTFYNNSKGDVDSLQWNFGSDANPADTTGAGPHKVVYDTPGAKDITLKVEGENGKDSLTKAKNILVSDKLHIFFSQPEKNIGMGEEVTIKVNGEAENYIWEDAEGLVETQGSYATIYLNKEEPDTIFYKVTGITENCEDTDSIKVIYSMRPENDDVCDAFELEVGTNGPFTNEFATVQPNEPMPDTTGSNPCEEEMKWCAEGGLQHTVWFKFTMPDTGAISFITKRLDTQIALYEAEKCDDILVDDKHTLLAANDDYFGEEENYAAAIMDLEGLTKGETYWLQMDGSAGGVTGEFTIEVKGDAVTSAKSHVNIQDHFEIFPNPSTGDLSISFNDVSSGEASVKIHTLEGKLIFTDKLLNIMTGKQYELSLPEFNSGIYLFSVITEDGKGTKKLIIK